MIFTETKIPGAMIIELDKLGDERGFFARSYCYREFEEHGLNPNVVQCNVSFNREKGTFRGLHSQAAGYEEAKLVRCTRGALCDIILDLRADSAAYMTYIMVELTPENHKMLFVPEGVFHGFLTLEENTEVFYQMSEYYVPKVDLGVRWDDPAFGITLPGKVRVISEKDAAYPDFIPAKTV